ncbi:MAG: hypothetical protein K1X72_27130 [Pyrinomonadaceae bacterium]|nr:hypothetical protein [Pyrinomonadaceae bacterium]
MKKSLIIVTVISLLVAFSSVAFGQKNKKTNQNPNSQAGSEAATTNNTSQSATKEQSEQMKVRDKNVWYNAKVYVELALSYLVNPANGFEDDNTFRLLKQYTQQAHAIIICHEAGTNPCNSSGETEQRRSSTMENVKNNLINAKNDLTHHAFSNSDKTNALNKLNRAIELADTYLAAHSAPPPTEKGKGETSSSSNSTNPPIDESTKTQKGTNPIANGTTNSTTSNSTQKTANPNTGFMDYTDDAVKATPKSTKKTTNKSVGPNGIEMTPCDVQNKSGQIGDCAKVNEGNNQRSTKSTNLKVKTTAPNKQVDTNFQTTSEDLQSVKSAKTSNTQRSTKNTNSKIKNAKTTNWEMADQDLVKPTTPANQRKPKTKAKKTTTTPANTTPKKP